MVDAQKSPVSALTDDELAQVTGGADPNAQSTVVSAQLAAHTLNTPVPTTPPSVQ